MSFTDPRDVPGSMSGPGGPHDRGSVVFEADRAILLRGVEVAAVDSVSEEGTNTLLAMVLEGRINFTPDMAQVLFIFNADGAAAIVTELVGVIGRMPPGDLKMQFMENLDERFQQLKNDGNLDHREETGDEG